jgi:three-Cys-motif partner protein
MKTDFFAETTEQSTVKATIVSKYFWAWAKVIIPTAKKGPNRIAYVDLFAGPGRYKDGTKSTPLLVLEQAITDPDMRTMLVTHFNDKDEAHVRELERAIDQLPGVKSLAHKPVVHNEEVGTGIVAQFEKIDFIPTLFFVDPWGYKGLSLDLVNLVLKHWGCDCIFFFNYNRINMGLGNPLVRQHMDCLFGAERANDIRAQLEPWRRKIGNSSSWSTCPRHSEPPAVGLYCHSDSRTPKASRTSHHLIFVRKHFRGYEK